MSHFARKDSLDDRIYESVYYETLAKELEEGVEPFREENFRLIKENSQLRLAIQKNEEKLDDKLQDTRSKRRDLESENAELKLLVTQFVKRVKQQQQESLEKTRRLAQLQERNLQSNIIMTDGSKRDILFQKQFMEIDDLAPKLCPHCIRIRNFAHSEKNRDLTGVDYIKVADSRIETLTLQNRALKTTQQDLMDLVKSMKVGIEMREAELDKLKVDIKLGMNLSVESFEIIGSGDHNHDVVQYHGKGDIRLALKSAQLQLQILQRRNLDLERKLQNNFLQGYDHLGLNRSRTMAERHLITSMLSMDGADSVFMHSENATTEEKMRLLETQLSHCCQEKAKLKALLEDCERTHKRRKTTPEPDKDFPSSDIALREETSSPTLEDSDKLSKSNSKKTRSLMISHAVKKQSKSLVTKPTNKNVPSLGIIKKKLNDFASVQAKGYFKPHDKSNKLNGKFPGSSRPLNLYDKQSKSKISRDLDERFGLRDSGNSDFEEVVSTDTLNPERGVNFNTKSSHPQSSKHGVLRNSSSKSQKTSYDQDHSISDNQKQAKISSSAPNPKAAKINSTRNELYNTAYKKVQSNNKSKLKQNVGDSATQHRSSKNNGQDNSAEHSESLDDFRRIDSDLEDSDTKTCDNIPYNIPNENGRRLKAKGLSSGVAQSKTKLKAGMDSKSHGKAKNMDELLKPTKRAMKNQKQKYEAQQGKSHVPAGKLTESESSDENENMEDENTEDEEKFDFSKFSPVESTAGKGSFETDSDEGECGNAFSNASTNAKRSDYKHIKPNQNEDRTSKNKKPTRKQQQPIMPLSKDISPPHKLSKPVSKGNGRLGSLDSDDERDPGPRAASDSDNDSQDDAIVTTDYDRNKRRDDNGSRFVPHSVLSANKRKDDSMGSKQKKMEPQTKKNQQKKQGLVGPVLLKNRTKDKDTLKKDVSKVRDIPQQIFGKEKESKSKKDGFKETTNLQTLGKQRSRTDSPGPKNLRGFDGEDDLFTVQNESKKDATDNEYTSSSPSKSASAVGKFENSSKNKADPQPAMASSKPLKQSRDRDQSRSRSKDPDFSGSILDERCRVKEPTSTAESKPADAFPGTMSSPNLEKRRKSLLEEEIDESNSPVSQGHGLDPTRDIENDERSASTAYKRQRAPRPWPSTQDAIQSGAVSNDRFSTKKIDKDKKTASKIQDPQDYDRKSNKSIQKGIGSKIDDDSDETDDALNETDDFDLNPLSSNTKGKKNPKSRSPSVSSDVNKNSESTKNIKSATLRPSQGSKVREDKGYMPGTSDATQKQKQTKGSHQSSLRDDVKDHSDSNDDFQDNYGMPLNASGNRSQNPNESLDPRSANPNLARQNQNPVPEEGRGSLKQGYGPASNPQDSRGSLKQSYGLKPSGNKDPEEGKGSLKQSYGLKPSCNKDPEEGKGSLKQSYGLKPFGNKDPDEGKGSLKQGYGPASQAFGNKDGAVLPRRGGDVDGRMKKPDPVSGSGRQDYMPLGFNEERGQERQDEDYYRGPRSYKDTRVQPAAASYNPFTSAPTSAPLMDNSNEVNDLYNRIRGLERLIDKLQGETDLAKAGKRDLEMEIHKLRRALTECHEHGQQLRNENQKTKIILEQTEALLNDTQRKAAANYVPTQRENQELNQQVRQLMAREMVMEREIAEYTSTIKALDRDKDEMRVELDRKDEQLARVQAESVKSFEQVSKLQLQLKNAELQIGHTGEASRDQEREILQLKRHIDTLKSDLDSRIRERDTLQRDLQRVSQSSSKTDLERRNMSVELEKRGKESDELRKQLQKYIDEVRRIEDLLFKKEEELELLIDSYSALSQEKGMLESQRLALERSISSARNEARDEFDSTALQASKLASQQTMAQVYEEEIAKLSIQVSTFENQLKTSQDREKLLQVDLNASRDLCLKLETKLDSMRLETANAESVKNKLQAENSELRSNYEMMESQLASDEANTKNIENLVAKMRENEYKAQQVLAGTTSDKNMLTNRVSTLQNRTEQLTTEIEKYRMKSAELQSELEKVKRQYQSEKTEREAALAELKRIQAQLSTSSTSLLMTSALASSRTPSPSPYQPTFSSGSLLHTDVSPVVYPQQQPNDTLVPSPFTDLQQ